MKQSITFRYKEIDLEWFGWCMLCKKGKFKPLKLCYNNTAGWWVNSELPTHAIGDGMGFRSQ